MGCSGMQLCAVYMVVLYCVVECSVVKLRVVEFSGVLESRGVQ